MLSEVSEDRFSIILPVKNTKPANDMQTYIKGFTVKQCQPHVYRFTIIVPVGYIIIAVILTLMIVVGVLLCV